MKPPRYTKLCSALLLLLGSASSWGQQAQGLQLGAKEKPTIGIKLRITNSGSRLFSIPSGAAPVENSRPNVLSSSILADWQFHPDGLIARTGLVWQASESGLGELQPGGQYKLKNAETYLGVGWSSKPFGARSWRFSADLGSFVSRGGLQGAAQHSTSSQPLNLKEGNTGLRWKPYVAIGVELDY